jgi:LPS export ABC transporter permease LptF
MRLLDRYVAREVVSHSALGLVVFTFVFFVPQLVRLMELIVRHSGSAWSVALLFLCALPPVLGFTLPMAVLVGVLIGLGRLSADSEIVALHASGISLRRLLLPISVVALTAATVTLLTTFWLSPASLRTVRRLEAQLLSSQARFSVQPRVFDERFRRFVLYVQDVEAAATRWRGVFLASTGDTSGLIESRSVDRSDQSRVTTAEDAFVVTGPSKGQIDIHLGLGDTHEYDPRYPAQYNVTTFGETDIPVDVSAVAAPARADILPPAEQPVTALVTSHGPNWRESRVELHRRIAFPAACLVFALLGVPIGVRPRRGGRATGLVLALILIGGYYFLFVSGDHFAVQGRILPWMGVWAANIVGAIVGLFFLRRVENIRKPNRILEWLEFWWSRRRATANGGVVLAGNGARFAVPSSGRIRQALRIGRTMAFPMLVDVYLLRQVF